MSDAPELTGLALYGAGLAAVDTAIAEAEGKLTSDAVTLEECVQIVAAFEAAQRGLAALRWRADRAGRRLYRSMLRAAVRARE